jgi:hypothetical protein
VYVRDPWGIGPKNIALGGRFFSFHKAAHIMAVVEKVAKGALRGT